MKRAASCARVNTNGQTTENRLRKLRDQEMGIHAIARKAG